jgi:hypothetical protein
MQNVGWAEPQFILGECRTQVVAGFRYLYLEEKHIAEWDVGDMITPLKDRITRAYRQTYGGAEPPTLLVMFIDLEEQYYDVRAGFAVGPDTPPLEGPRVLDVPPALCAGYLAWGANFWEGYGPLMDYMDAQGLRCIEGWREWYLYSEGEGSPNNIMLVQHVAEAAS